MNIQNRISSILILPIVMICLLKADAQDNDTKIKSFIETQCTEWGLEKTDIDDLHLQYKYDDEKSKKTRYYYVQRYKGVEIEGAMLNVSIDKKGKISYVGHRLLNRLDQRIAKAKESISAREAIYSSLNDQGILNATVPKQEQDGLYDLTGLVNTKAKVDKKYYQDSLGQLHLVWNVDFGASKKTGAYVYKINVENGQIINKYDKTLHCGFSGKHESCSLIDHHHDHKRFTTTTQEENLLAGAYRVFPFPAENPLQTNQMMVNDPNDPIASPFGWHDTDGTPGPEFTITRGNNAWAFQDRDNNGFSEADEPDGGAGLNFNFPYNANLEPEQQQEAAVVNLFYATNYMHDYAHHFGFNEAAGNFQVNNYGKGGLGQDMVVATAQTGAQNERRVNDAEFVPASDGFPGRMGIFVFTKDFAANNLIEVTAPASAAGRYEAGTPDGWGWGVNINNTPLPPAPVVIADDGVYQKTLTDACESIRNNSEVNGKIAIIDRGSCDFSTKALNAQNAGAVGVIICNTKPDGTINMGPGIDGGRVNIPALSMTRSDCAKIRVLVDQGLTIGFNVPQIAGPDHMDGDFDNGIIAHEYAHGISHRLTGGPRTVGCLNNDEQAGEGWSDFFTLVTTAKTGDQGTTPRGIGTFPARSPSTAKGIRTFPYSTDMSVNPYTYADLPNVSIPHGVGTVFCSMVWDMYWLLVEKYGFKQDYKDATAGNNIAVQLIIDGMKNQPCSPGFVDVRDAILQADQDLYNGANEELIWTAFARRGLGYLATQGSPFNANDGIADFSMPPKFVKEVVVQKLMTPLVNAGEETTVNVVVINQKDENITSVKVTDPIPNGATYVAGSMSRGLVPSSSSGEILVDLPEIVTQDTFEFSYRLKTNANNPSIRHFLESVDPTAVDRWLDVFLGQSGDDDPGNNWEITTRSAYAGDYSWFVPDTSLLSQQVLFTERPILVKGSNPVLRFYHKYDTEPGLDAGIVEVTTDPDPFVANWLRTEDEMIRNPYTSIVGFTTFAIYNIQAFWGDSDGWRDTYISLADYKNQEINIRFNFGTNDTGAPGGPDDGWFVDEIEQIDMVNYNSELCLTTQQGDNVCTTAPGGGTIIEAVISTSSEEVIHEKLDAKVFPNPTADILNVDIFSPKPGLTTLSLTTIDGKVVLNKSVQIFDASKIETINVNQLQRGLYLLEIQNDSGIILKKVFVQ